MSEVPSRSLRTSPGKQERRKKKKSDQKEKRRTSVVYDEESKKKNTRLKKKQLLSNNNPSPEQLGQQHITKIPHSPSPPKITPTSNETTESSNISPSEISSPRTPTQQSPLSSQWSSTRPHPSPKQIRQFTTLRQQSPTISRNTIRTVDTISPRQTTFPSQHITTPPNSIISSPQTSIISKNSSDKVNEIAAILSSPLSTNSRPIPKRNPTW
jgi:hypothetical protein